MLLYGHVDARAVGPARRLLGIVHVRSCSGNVRLGLEKCWGHVEEFGSLFWECQGHVGESSGSLWEVLGSFLENSGVVLVECGGRFRKKISG